MKKIVFNTMQSVRIYLVTPHSFIQSNKGHLAGFLCCLYHLHGRCSGLVVSVLDSGLSGPGSGPGRGHCVVFLGKTLYLNDASLHPGV